MRSTSHLKVHEGAVGVAEAKTVRGSQRHFCCQGASETEESVGNVVV